MRVRWRRRMFLVKGLESGFCSFQPDGRQAEYGFNGLKGAVLEYGEREVLSLIVPRPDGTTRGSASDRKLGKSGLASLQQEIMCSVVTAGQTLTNEEVEWIRDLDGLLACLGSFDETLAARPGNLSDEEVLKRREAIRAFGLLCANALAKLVQGYTDAKNPRCPACPVREKHASQRTWQRRIDPVSRYLAACQASLKDETALLPQPELAIPPRLVLGQAKQAKLVLVVDDDPNVNEGLSDILATEGYLVESVCNGSDAVGAARRLHCLQTPFDIGGLLAILKSTLGACPS